MIPMPISGINRPNRPAPAPPASTQLPTRTDVQWNRPIFRAPPLTPIPAPQAPSVNPAEPRRIDGPFF
jgi:hypothetical protein